MLEIIFFTPHPLLRDLIQCIMVVHHKIDLTNPAAICHYPPTPQPSLFFYIGDKIKVKKEDEKEFTEQPTSVIVGQQLKKVSIDINKNHKAVRVGFHPGGMYRLLGIPMAQITEGHYAADDIFGKEIREVNERLPEAADSYEIKSIIESFLLKQLKQVRPASAFDGAMLELLQHQGNIPIEQVASLACLSLRQFERISKERIGLPPKLFARIVRFSKAYRLREENPRLSWTQIAYECGYFDQMHFIRDFKQFAGLTPGLAEKALEQQPVKMQVGLRL